MTLNTKTHLLLFSVFVLAACEKVIDLDVPVPEPRLVIEGRVENGQPPVVFVTTTRGFFEPTDLNAFAETFVDDAEVSVNGIALQRICSDEIPPALAPLFEEATGISAEATAGLSICGYVGTDPALIGEENTTYRLEVNARGQTLTSAAHLPGVLAPDSVWFRLWANSPRLGYAFMKLTDPDTTGNAYRVFTRRIGPNENNNDTDPTFYPPPGSAFADDFFNGETIEVFFVRGQPPNSSRPGDTGETARFFEIGDRFVFKFCSTSYPVYDFFRTYEAQQGSAGSPFAAPNNLNTNIEGGLGVWAAYACTFDTLTATP